VLDWLSFVQASMTTGSDSALKAVPCHRCPVDGCGYASGKKSSVTRHLAIIHNIGVQWHTCPMAGCTYKAKQRSHMPSHMASKHNVGVQWRTCPVEFCGYKSKDKSSLSRHLFHVHKMSPPNKSAATRGGKPSRTLKMSKSNHDLTPPRRIPAATINPLDALAQAIERDAASSSGCTSDMAFPTASSSSPTPEPVGNRGFDGDEGGSPRTRHHAGMTKDGELSSKYKVATYPGPVAPVAPVDVVAPGTVPYRTYHYPVSTDIVYRQNMVYAPQNAYAEPMGSYPTTVVSMATPTTYAYQAPGWCPIPAS